MRRLIIFLVLALLAPADLPAMVYTVDGLIDENRMAADKMYYDLYYNPGTKIFQRNDLKPLSQTAVTLIEKAIESKIDRAAEADQAGRSEYNKTMTGANNCTGDPYIGSGTAVNPEVQDPAQPGCLQGGANYADESIGYVYMISGANKARNAKEVTDTYRTGSFNGPVPRVLYAPSSDEALKASAFTVHNGPDMVWRNGVPAGLDSMDYLGNCPNGYNPQTGKRCFEVVEDGGHISFTQSATWAEQSGHANMLATVNFDRLTIENVDATLNQDGLGDVANRHYTFIIDNYTVTKDVKFCDAGWKTNLSVSYSGEPDYGQSVSGSFCGGTYTCTRSGPTGCNAYAPADAYDLTGAAKCTDPTYTYTCRVPGPVCCVGGLPSACGNIQVGSISVSSPPVTISISLPGSDISLEPLKVSAHTPIIYQAAAQQLPANVMVNGKAIKDISLCDGTPSSWSSCR